MKRLLLILAACIMLACSALPVSAYIVVKQVPVPGAGQYVEIGEVGGPLLDPCGYPMFYWADDPILTDYLFTSSPWWQGESLSIGYPMSPGPYHLDTFWPDDGTDANPGYFPEDVFWTVEPGYDYYVSINPVVDKFDPVWDEVYRFPW